MAMKKKGYKKGGAVKKMGGGRMTKKPVAMKKGSKIKKKTMAKGGAVKKMGGGRMMKKKTMAKGGKTRR